MTRPPFALSILACLIGALSLMCHLTVAHMIELEPSAEECFFEDLNPGDQVRVAFVCFSSNAQGYR